MKVDVAVVGNGLIGLCSAVELRRAGRTVALLGGPTDGRASTAAAGMLTPACEYDPWMPSEFLDLLRDGLARYPEFLGEFGLTAAEVGYRSTDFTLVDLAERTESLRPRIEWMTAAGVDCEWVGPRDLCTLEPALTPRAHHGAIRIHGEAVVNPRALLSALERTADRLGVHRVPGDLTGVEDEGEALRLVTAAGTVGAERVVVAAGSWSGQVGELFGLSLPVCPVKGQMLRLSGPPGLLNSVVFMPSGGCGSIVERSPGQYVVGTSEEYLRPEADNTAGVVAAILSRLCTVLPEAADWPVEEMWSGFRPMTSDELPIIDRPGDGRVVVATGHHRNGVLLAPITGRLVTRLIDGEHPGADLSRYRHGRTLRPHTRFATKY
ncbi:FAD-dependent oxidoreductase [Streptomyces sp. XY431]|uniref:NAD(P)/FAD-dependent oxidoreductase n=1 Tax=Streptomyces sp. XY431 TaxID=1415562 RepID=UPI0006AE8314|nr:FAD-dependent oxidoreductase [Streptomyces sp. XY431]